MHISNTLKLQQQQNQVLKVVLDESRLYVEESLGSVMVRGEVIVNFAKDTPIQGPIELLFEGVQRFTPWSLIMKGHGCSSPIETKLQVIELSLLPPNSRGIMPAGTQRFPFEFPVPATLPASTFIQDRLEIFYQLSATIHRSALSEGSHRSESMSPLNWIDWTRRNNKKKYVATTMLRIVRAVESAVAAPLPSTTSALSPSSPTPANTISTSSPSDNSNSPSTEPQQSQEQNMVLPWNRRGLDAYQGTYDEQPDQLAFSLAGRSSGNLTQPVHMLQNVQGIRYKIGVDRTAIALGTSVGVEIMVEPTCEDAIIKKILLKVTESRKYTMKVPAGYNWGQTKPATMKQSENVRMVLKWAYGYQMQDEEEESKVHKHHGDKGSSTSKGGERYLRQRTENSQYLAYFDPPMAGGPEGKQFLNSTFSKQHYDDKGASDHKHEYENTECTSSSSSSSSAEREMINLKELNQPVRVGEYFGGRFIVPVPGCSNILHPSMSYESIKIDHWIQLAVTIECNGKLFDLTLDSPGRILDCRLVADDENQTILPPPPSYNPGDARMYNENNWSQSTFWEQREPITFESGWGSCRPCPCEFKQMKEAAKKKNSSKSTATTITTNTCLPSQLPEWGPPPCYTDN